MKRSARFSEQLQKKLLIAPFIFKHCDVVATTILSFPKPLDTFFSGREYRFDSGKKTRHRPENALNDYAILRDRERTYFGQSHQQPETVRIILHLFII